MSNCNPSSPADAKACKTHVRGQGFRENAIVQVPQRIHMHTSRQSFKLKVFKHEIVALIFFGTAATTNTSAGYCTSVRT